MSYQLQAYYRVSLWSSCFAFLLSSCNVQIWFIEGAPEISFRINFMFQVFFIYCLITIHLKHLFNPWKASHVHRWLGIDESVYIFMCILLTWRVKKISKLHLPYTICLLMHCWAIGLFSCCICMSLSRNIPYLISHRLLLPCIISMVLLLYRIQGD